MKGNFHVQFLGGWGAAMLPGYPARLDSLATKGLAAYLIARGPSIGVILEPREPLGYADPMPSDRGFGPQEQGGSPGLPADPDSRSGFGVVCTRFARAYYSSRLTTS